jgi:hypothetical protein
VEAEANFLISNIRRLVKRYPDVVREETVAVMDTVVARLDKEVTERTPTGVGGQAGLRGSIRGETVTFGDQVRGTVGTPLEYAEPVEFGRKAGSFPPIEPIELWARRKLGVDSKEARSVAYAVAWKIYRKGTEGAHMFEKGWEASEYWVQNELQTITDRVIRRIERGQA